MPLDVKVDGERELIWASGRGVVVNDDLLDYVRIYLIEQGLRSYDEIFDLSKADLLDLTYEGLAAVAAAAAPTDPQETPTKIAILVSESVSVGISRMYQTLREDRGGRRNLRIFWELSELLEWMELPADVRLGVG
jgi:hypothetical protein